MALQEPLCHLKPLPDFVNFPPQISITVEQERQLRNVKLKQHVDDGFRVDWLMPQDEGQQTQPEGRNMFNPEVSWP